MQISQITTTLTQILMQINNAAAQGSAYLSSSAYQTQVSTWTQTLSQLQVQLMTILTQASNNSGTANTGIAQSGSCQGLMYQLDVGMSGQAVSVLQQFLQSDPSAQYTGQISGYYDSATELAVERFQTAQNIVTYGSPDTTGFGRVGGRTLMAMQQTCASEGSGGSAVNSPASIGVPTMSGNTATFVISSTAPGCAASGYTVSFDDGQQQTVVFPASCSMQTQTITHTYTQAGGNHRVILSNGSFTMTRNFIYTSNTTTNPQPSSSSFTLASVSGSTANISVTSSPDYNCDALTYTISFGDGQQQTLTFPASCSAQMQTISHAYSANGTYTAALSGGASTATLLVTISSASSATGSLSLSNMSGNTATLLVTATSDTSCDAPSFTLNWGDGQQQTVTFNATCSSQTQAISHTYAQIGTYPTTLTSGAFSTNLSVNVAAPSPYSTGSVSIQSATTTDMSGGIFLVTANPNASCSATSYSLSFGDGQQSQLSFPASCSIQSQSTYHSFATAGSYSAVLSSGSFSTNMAFTIPLPGTGIAATATTTVSAGVGSGAVNAAVQVTPGTTCSSSVYTVNFGDSSSVQSLTFPFTTSSCGVQTLTATHTYALNGTYTIVVTSPQGTTQSIPYTVANVYSAGAGDPFQMLSLLGSGANNSTSFVDSSPVGRTLTAKNAFITTGTSTRNGSSIQFTNAYVSAAASNDFDYDVNPFTIDLWFDAASFPATGQQASLIMQANSQGTDPSLGGAGLELFGNEAYFVGNIGGVVYHPFYNNTLHTPPLLPYSWYHIAAVRSGNIVTLYFNGNSVGSMNVSGAANASTNALTIGRYGELNTDYFNGWIDNVDVAKGIARWTSNFSLSSI